MGKLGKLGGLKGQGCLFFILLIIPIIYSYENIEHVSAMDTAIKISNTYHKVEVPISNIIESYDKNIKQQYDSFFGFVKLKLFGMPESGEEIINVIIENVNKELMGVSTNVTSICFKLMNELYKKDIFFDLRSLNDLDSTKLKIGEIEDKINNEIDKSTKYIKHSAISAVTSALSGDIITATGLAVHSGMTLLNILSSKNDIEIETKEIIKEESKKYSLSTHDKQTLEMKLYNNAKAYCSYGYNLQLTLDSFKNINIVGDKIDYSFIIKLIHLLEKNLDLKKNILKKEIDSESEQTQISIKELDNLNSLLERLDVLKSITEKISDFINFSLSSQFMKFQIYPTKHTLTNINIFFNEQLNELNYLVVKLNYFFPLKQEELEKQKKMLIEEQQIESIKQELLNINLNISNEVTRQYAERYVFNMENSWNVSELYIKSWFNIGKNTIKISGESLSILSNEFTQLIFNVLIETFDTFIKLGNDILFKVLINPIGLIFISVPLFMIILFICKLRNVIRIIKWTSQLSNRLLIFMTYMTTYNFNLMYNIFYTKIKYTVFFNRLIPYNQSYSSYTSEEKYVANILLELQNRYETNETNNEEIDSLSSLLSLMSINNNINNKSNKTRWKYKHRKQCDYYENIRQ